MAKIWCVCAPLYSHTDWGGFLKTSLELQRLGHEVTWVSQAGVAGAISAAGLPFRVVAQSGWLWPPPPAPDISTLAPQEAVMLRYRRALDTWLSTDLVSAAVQALIELAADVGKPDLIITDPFVTAAALGAEAIGVPLIVCGYPAMRDLNEDALFPVQKALGVESQNRVAALLDQFNLQGVNISKGAAPSVLSPHLHVSYFTPSWYQADTANLLDQSYFAGGLPDVPTDAPPQWVTDIPADAPIGLITLGTTFAGELGFYSWAAQAVARAGLVPVVALGWHPVPPEEKAKLLATLPKNTRLLNWVPLEHVLPRAKVMIHHGGMGTTHRAAVYGVPQIVVPHAADQRGQARRAAQAKVGLNLTAHDVRQGMLFEGVKALVSDEQVIANARALADELSALGGAPQAAQAIIETLEKKR